MTINKKVLYEACLEQQQKEVENFENRINALKKDMFADKESPSQGGGGNAGKMELLANYEKELAFSQMELNQLEALDPDVANTIVEPGAVVMTESLNLYISISTDKIELGGDNYIGISVKSPIYAVMQGKKKGETFTFNETSYTILNLF